MKNFYNLIQSQSLNQALAVLILSLFISFSSTSKAQVNYTDIVPDLLIEQQDSLYFDLDDDGDNDLSISQLVEQSSGAWQKYTVHLNEGTEVVIFNDSVASLELDDLIDENSNWSTDNEALLLYHSTEWDHSQSNWARLHSGFIGFRIMRFNQWNYGWLRLNTTSEGSFYYEKIYALDYAIQDLTNVYITAGDKLPSGATSLYTQDINDYFDGRDIQVSFTKAFNESLFSEYRVFLAKADDENADNLDYMNQLAEEKYLSILVDPSDTHFNVETTLLQQTVDIDGDAVNPNIHYRIHILNIANSGNAGDNILSAPSTEFSLQYMLNPVTNVISIDNGNNNSSDDIQIAFKSYNNESYLSEYRIFISPEEDASNLTLETALTLSEEYYTAVNTDDNTPIQLKEFQKDINGDLITENISYQTIILIVADDNYSNTSILCTPSRKFTLRNPNIYSAGQTTGSGVESYVADDILSNTDEWDGIWDDNPYGEAGHSYIDLNRDGITDFQLMWFYSDRQSYTEEGYNISPERDNKVLIGKNSYIDNLSEGEIIDSSYTFSTYLPYLWKKVDYTNSSTDDFFYSNLPMNFQDEIYYIGFCIMDGDQPQYAWLKLRGKKFLKYGFVDITSGITDQINQKSFNIYPSPSSNYINIKSSSNFSSSNEMSLSIINSMGQVIEEINDLQNDQIKDISNYPAGLYFIIIKDGGVVLETHRVIIE